MTGDTTFEADGPREDVVTLAHGAGGSAMRSLLQDLVVPRFADNGEGGEREDAKADRDEATADVGLLQLDDGAVHPIGEDGALVVTTDSHVVTPRFFPGGDIGRLAVAGTVNDLAVMGATEPVTLTCSLVLEEGTPTADVQRVIESMADTAAEAGTAISTGDTKVMGNGEVDGIVINTAGVGYVDRDMAVSDAGLQPGDAIIVSGALGDHGIALLSAREGFDFTGDLESDVAPVNEIVREALAAGTITAMKDPTRGGFANAVNEMAEKGEVGIELDEQAIPVSGATASAGEVLGIDPLAVANEGKVVFGVDSGDADSVLDAIQHASAGENAEIVGHVVEEHTGRVVVDTGFGRRYLTEPGGGTPPDLLMHEISVAHGILERALAAADDHGTDRIDELTLEIGRVTHVNPDQLVFCLEAIVEDTAAEGATIRTETIEPIATCDCGFRDEPDELALAAGFAPDVRCPNCGSRAELVQGRECRLASIEVPERRPVSQTDEPTPDQERRKPQSQ